MISWFKNTKIQNKLFVSFGLLISILLFLSVFAGFQLYTVDKNYSDLISSSIGGRHILGKIITSMERLFYINMNRSYSATIYMDAEDLSLQQDSYKRYFDELMVVIDDHYRHITLNNHLSDEDKREYLYVLEEVTLLLKNKYLPKIDELNSALRGDPHDVYRLIGESILISTQITEKMDALDIMISENAEHASDVMTAHSRQTISLLFLVIAFFVVVSALLSIFMTRKIKEPILSMENAMLEIINGDLSYPIRSDTRDELGMLSNQIADMVDSLGKTQEELRLALIVAEENAKAKSEFMDNMNHELRSPMNGVLGFLRLARQAGADQEKDDYVEKAERSAKDLWRIIEDVLDFTAIENKKMALNSMPFSLSEIINEVCEAYAPAIREKGIDLNTRLSPDIPDTLEGDSHKIRQILTNLVDNAAKFTEKGKITIRGRVKNESENHVEIGIYVKDTGIGMTPEQIEKLYTPFYQGDSSSTRKYGGTGMGLPLAKHLVSVLGGKVWVESEPDEGSTFHFSIRFNKRDASGALQDKAPQREVSRTPLAPEVYTPLSPPEAQTPVSPEAQTPLAQPEIHQTPLAQPGAQTPDSPEALTPLAPPVAQTPLTPPETQTHVSPKDALLTPLSPENASRTPFAPEDTFEPTDRLLLLVDDMEINQIIAEEMLTGIGYKVDIASNGQEAIDMLADKEYDAVLMDIQMPVMDGLTAAKTIRGDDKHKKLPIIAVSAHSLPTDIEKSLDHGMSDHIVKPIDPDVLEATLRKWLDPDTRVA